MSRYILRNNFQKLAESAGTVVNISTVKVELSEQAVAGTGVILYPRRKISFGSPIFAAKAAGESGAAVIGVIRRKKNSSSSSGSSGTFYDGDDEIISDEEVHDIFDGDNTETISNADLNTVIDGTAINNKDPAEGDEFITDEELKKLFAN